MTMLYDYFTPHQACCFVAGLHPNFNGCDDGLEMAEGIIEGGFKSGKLIADNEQQIKSASLKSFLYSKNWIVKGFNDNLTDDTYSPNKENAAYQKRISDLEQQLANEKATDRFGMGTPKAEQCDPKTNEQLINDFREQITQLTAENHNLNSRLSTARNTYKHHQSEIKELTEKNEQVASEKAELIEQLNEAKAKLEDKPTSYKELAPNSQAKVTHMLYAILKEHRYDLSPPKGKGVANDQIVAASRSHKSPVTRNFVANWLERVHQLDIDLNK